MQQNAQVNLKNFLLNIKYFDLVTAPMEVGVSTQKVVSVPQVSTPIETHEKPISSFVDESTEPALSRLGVTDDHTEIIKATYEDKIAKLHENYQYIIHHFYFFFNKFIYIYLEPKFVD
jgi:transcriptional antiterminator